MGSRILQTLKGPSICTELEDDHGAFVVVTPLRFFPVYHSRDRHADYVSDKSQTGVGFRK